MRKLLFAATAIAAIGVAAPAGAQVYLGADPGGVGVQVGPFGAGVGPGYWGGPRRHYERYGYVDDCRTIRTRVVTPSGRVIYRAREVC